MFLLPVPKEINIKEGHFKISPNTEIVLGASCTYSDLDAAIQLQNEIKNIIRFSLPITKAFKKDYNKSIYLEKQAGEEESYSITVTENEIIIKGADDAGLFYGVQSLRQVVRTSGREIPCLNISDEPHFKNRGFYHDVTRGKVPTLETLKELVDRISFYKINQLQLYIEHTFAFKNQSEVWIGADPLTAEEILILDEYCKKRHVELVPSISTFGHLYHLLSSHSFNHLCELEDSTGKPFSWIERMAHHTLDVTNDESMKFVEEMLEEFIPLFSSDKFNICCDETFDLGTGKSKAAADEKGKGQLYVEFLNKIIKAVQKYNKKVMFWGDIILNHKEYINKIPKDVIFLNWNYAPNVDEHTVKEFAEYDCNQYVCPGVSGWNTFMNFIDSSFLNISKMVQYGYKYNAIGVLNTDWGDYGHINLFGNSMPGMMYGAALSWNPKSLSDFEEAKNIMSHIEYNDASGKLVGLLNELACQQTITFLDIVWWKEDKCGETTYLNGNIKNRFKKCDIDTVFERYKRTLQIKDEVMNMYPSLAKDRDIDFQEFCISADGIAIANSLYLIYRKYECNEDVKLIHKPDELAVKIEYWMADFMRIWRLRNKESELYRIRDTFAAICSWLRTY